jgi:hypothetical protein
MHPFRTAFPIKTALACLLCLCALALQADPPTDKGKPAGKGNMSQMHMYGSLSGTISAGISIGDARQLAQRYDMTGQQSLPPGIRKNLARGKPLPPGIEKTRMPDGFIQALPQHQGYEWRRAGADLVLVASGTLVISDILEGVFD